MSDGLSREKLLESISDQFKGRGSSYGVKPGMGNEGPPGVSRTGPLERMYNAVNNMAALGEDRPYKLGSPRWDIEEGELARLLTGRQFGGPGDLLRYAGKDELTHGDMLRLLTEGIAKYGQ